MMIRKVCIIVVVLEFVVLGLCFGQNPISYPYGAVVVWMNAYLYHISPILALGRLTSEVRTSTAWLSSSMRTSAAHGPSTIGLDTIHKSKGKIPEVFLRGCVQIEQAKLANPDLTDQEITDIGYKIIELRSDQSLLEFYSYFISYSSADDELARKTHQGMQDSGVGISIGLAAEFGPTR